MNPEKTGKYIAERRKAMGMTQKELAEKIAVSDKAISKWECGNGLPDITRVKDLCIALEINVNELLSGEALSDSEYSLKAEENIMALIKDNEKQKSNNRVQYIVGAVLAPILMCLLGIGISGASVQSVSYYVDPTAFLYILAFLAVSVFLGKDKSAKGILTTIQKLVIPIGVFIAIFEAVFMLGNISDLSAIGPLLVLTLLVPFYSIGIYIIVTIVLQNIKEQ